MHLSFKSLTVTSVQSLQASLMDIHHNISFRSILEDDLISFAFKVHICFCSNKGVELWLNIKPSICLFHIANYIFTLVLHFHLVFMCECGHGLNVSDTQLTRCSFEGQ